MVEEGTLDGGLKGGGKEESGEGEWVSLNILSFRKIKIWQNYSTSLELKRREERGVSWNEGEGGLYSSSWGNMNEISFNESWKRIMNLDLILTFGKI